MITRLGFICSLMVLMTGVCVRQIYCSQSPRVAYAGLAPINKPAQIHRVWFEYFWSIPLPCSFRGVWHRHHRKTDLRVVQTDGSPATLKGSTIRDLPYHIDVLFFGHIGYMSMKEGPLQQGYGDVWAKAVVVRKSVFQPHPVRSPFRMFAGIVMGSFLWSSMLMLQLILKII